jgi:hypothetical protein
MSGNVPVTLDDGWLDGRLTPGFDFSKDSDVPRTIDG